MCVSERMMVTHPHMHTNHMQDAGDTVLVAGATGGVGQLATAKLLDVSEHESTPQLSQHALAANCVLLPHAASCCYMLLYRII